MAAYVNKLRRRFGGLAFCHLLADTEEELHAIAARIGVDSRLFQGEKIPHYDISQAKRALALAAGAVEIDRDRLAELIRNYTYGRR